MNPQVWWYVARASGIVAWLLLTASVAWGILLSTRAFPSRRRPAWLRDLHTWLGGLTVGFVALHLTALVADSYLHFGVRELLVPFASTWRPGAVALGVVATWLLVALEVTSLAMRRLPRRVWHAVHLTSYAVFWLGTFHGIMAGTDATNAVFVVTGALVIGASVWAMIHRLLEPAGRAGRTATARTTAP